MTHPFPHVIVTGHGRSGTNLVLDLLDCSAHTICRNEVNAVKGSNLAVLGPGFFSEGVGDIGAEAQRFSQLLEQAKTLITARDRLAADHKIFYRQLWLLKLIYDLRRRSSTRKVLQKLRGATYRDQWAFPCAVYDQAAFEKALPVYKILLWSGRFAALHDHLHEQRLIHVLREPKGFLRSWHSRYVHRFGDREAQVFQDNAVSAERIMRHYGQDPDRIKAFSQANLLESELWRWRYVNEELYSKLRGSDRYLLVRYADTTGDKSGTAKKMAAFCGLDFDTEFEARCVANDNALFAKSFQSRVADEIVDEVVARVLTGSLLTELL